MWVHAVTGATESGTVSLFYIRHFHVKAGESITAAKQVSRHARYHTWTFELTHLKRKAWFLLLWSATIAVKMSPVKAMKVKTQMGVLVNIWLSHTVDTKSNMTPLQRDQLTHTHCSLLKKQRHLAAHQKCHHVTASKNWKQRAVTDKLVVFLFYQM